MSKQKINSTGRQNKNIPGTNEAKKQPATPSRNADAMDSGSQGPNESASGNENPRMISSVALPGQTPAVKNAASNGGAENTISRNENEALRPQGDTPGEENATSYNREAPSKPNKNGIIWLFIIICIIGIGGTFLWMMNSAPEAKEDVENVPVALPWLISFALVIILSICIIFLLVKSLRDSFAERLGYAKRNEVEDSIANISHTIGKDMDEQQFATLSLEEKFAALTKDITQLMADNDEALDKEKAATAAAQSEAEKQAVARTISEDTLSQKVNDAVKRAEDAENRLAGAQDTINNSNQKIIDLEQQINNLNKEIDRLKNENKGLTDKVNNLGQLSSDKDELRKQLQDLQEECNKIEKERDTIQDELDGLQTTHRNLETELNDIKSQKDSLQSEYDERKARFEQIEASDAGQLTATIEAKEKEIRELSDSTENALREKDEIISALSEAKKKAEGDKAETERQLETARQTIDDQQQELNTERTNSKELRKTVTEREKTIELLKSQTEKDADEIKRQKEELDNRQNIINEKGDEINQLKEDKAALQSAKENLEQTVSGLEIDKASLTEVNQIAKRELSEKAEFILSERDEFAKTMMSLAKALSDASGKDFLGCCDDAFENNRVSLQEKVAKPMRAFEREMADIDPEKYSSRDELADAYYALVKAQFDEASGLTRIAQWYAYSQVAFMADEDRSDGLFIRQQEINDIYDLAVKLMGNVGIAFSLPALYAERFPENGKYDDVTGQRQLNIEYMCPTARNHKENIDSTDTSQVIIDVVEVGYTDSKGNRKKSQVII